MKGFKIRTPPHYLCKFNDELSLSQILDVYEMIIKNFNRNGVFKATSVMQYFRKYVLTSTSVILWKVVRLKLKFSI